jgi:hypothetical protein
MQSVCSLWMHTCARGHKRLPLSVKRDERFSCYDHDAVPTTDGNKISVPFPVPSRTGIAHQRQHALQVNIAIARVVSFSPESNGRFLALWITSPLLSVSSSRRFEGTYRLHPQRFEVRP